MFHKIRRIHFVGIGGTGMCGIAEVLVNLGFEVSGSDLADGDSVRRLARLGCRVAIGHASENVGDAEVVVVSTAVPPTNAEVVRARELQIPVIPRAEMLAELMRMKFGIAVGGAHGKTTATWLSALVLQKGGLDPTIVVGGRLRALGTNARLGQGDILVAEADESDGSFLRLTPTLAVITNLDREHLDHYGSLERIRETFLKFGNRVPFYGATILCLDDPLARGLVPELERRVITYGFGEEAEVRAVGRSLRGTGSVFTVLERGTSLGEVALAVPGEHNVRNALAAVCVGRELGVPFSAIRDGLAEFSGIARRLEIRSDADDVLVIDDYAHHPTEIEATLAAVAEAYPRRSRFVIFQPHRYTRTRDLGEQFGPALRGADHVVVTSVYSAGEEPIAGVDARRIVAAARQAGVQKISYVDSWEEAVDLILPEVEAGDLVLTLGAGDVWKAGDLLAARIAASPAGAPVRLSEEVE
jgi:UDP-N-acetylmuramate--alanine ligase